jgi:hypothetical protein
MLHSGRLRPYSQRLNTPSYFASSSAKKEKKSFYKTTNWCPCAASSPGTPTCTPSSGWTAAPSSAPSMGPSSSPTTTGRATAKTRSRSSSLAPILQNWYQSHKNCRARVGQIFEFVKHHIIFENVLLRSSSSI